MRNNSQRRSNASTGTLAAWDNNIKRPMALLAFALFVASGVVSFFTTRAAIDSPLKKQAPVKLARLNEHISVRSTSRGNPWVNLADGHDLLTNYVGREELCAALEENHAQPRSLASADYTEDGVPDLISGYGWLNRGIVAIHRGNIDFAYPNTTEASQRKAEGVFADSPFLSPALVFGTPEAPDFIGAGDFDGDGHWDVATASHGSDKLWLLPGSGRGTLSEPKAIALPGRVTAMVAGEVNRRDGLDDLVVGVSTPDGAKLLVFEGPEGALSSKPEVLSMPAEVTSLALGQLDDSLETDIAVAAGRDLIIVRGRDRKLSLDEITRLEASESRSTARSFPSVIRAIAIGDFSGSNLTEIALLSEEGSLQLLTPGQSNEQFTSRAIGEWTTGLLARRLSSGIAQLVCAHVSSIPIDNILVVDSKSQSLELVADSAEEWCKRQHGSAAAASYLGVSAALDVEDGPAAVLPMRLNGDALSDLVILRSRQSSPVVAMTQPQAIFTVSNTANAGFGSLRDAISQANSNLGADTIRFSIPGSGVRTITLTSPLPQITDAVTIDGTSQPDFSGSPIIELNGSNFPAEPGGVDGLHISAGGSTVRGLVINRFGDDAIELATNGGNRIEGNRLGCDATGSLARGSLSGVFINGSPNNVIGGTAVASRNIISGNGREFRGQLLGVGIQIDGATATGNLIQGNFIGTSATGTFALANASDGIRITTAAGTTVGGTAAGARNVISGNSLSGIAIGALGGTVQGNLIGLSASGNAAIGNGVDGVTSSGASTIGGTISAARNIISGNFSDGIQLSGSNNQAQGNFIGTDIGGSIDVGNAFSGVFFNDARNSTVGGSVAGARNVVSGNNSAGIALERSIGNQVQNNFIGLNAAATAALSNAKSGVYIRNSSKNTIGGTGLGNAIAFNGGDGVSIRSDAGAVSGNAVLSNSIFSNGGLGIRLQPGANNDQNPPALTSVMFSDGPATIQGVLNSAPNNNFTVQLFSNTACDSSGFGEGQVLIQSLTVTTDTNGSASFSTSPLVFSGRITATATDPNGNTSEFSRCVDSAPQGADLLIASSPSTFTAVTKSLITYGIRVTNGGPGTATEVTVNNPTPAGTQFILLEASRGTSIQPPFGGSGPITVSLGSILPGGVATIKITVLVTAATGATIFDTATVTSASNDPILGNNSATVTTDVVTDGLVLGVADLSVTSTGSSSTVAAGTRLTYTLRVRNAGPDPAFSFNLLDRIPDNTTFAPVTEPLCAAPPPGTTGLLKCSFVTSTNPLPSGGLIAFTLPVNVIAGSGSTLANHAEIFVPFSSLEASEGGPNGGIALQVTSPADDPNPSNNVVDANTPVEGGSLVRLSWRQPTLNPVSADAAKSAAPADLRITPLAALANEMAPARKVVPAENGSCFLKRVNIYKSDFPNVQTIPDNLWKSVPPDQLAATMAARPGGSFWVLTNVWDCGGMEIDSGRSNESTTAPGPMVNKITIGSKIKVNGSGFTDEVQVFIDDVGFRKRASVTDGVSIKQKGLLTNGKSLDEAAPFNRTVMIKFLNSDGGMTIVPFTRSALTSSARRTMRP